MTKNVPAEAYPLQWPVTRPRVPVQKRRRAAYTKGNARLTVGNAIDRLLPELRRLGARGVVVSSNVPVRNDGLPYSNVRQPDDPGVAVYFALGDEQRCLPCDAFDRVADNLAAVAQWVEAERAQLRCGVGDLEAAFAGFRALPPPTVAAGTTARRAADILCRRCSAVTPTEVLTDPAKAAEAYRRSALVLHPDGNGGEQLPEWQALQDAKAVIDRHHEGTRGK